MFTQASRNYHDNHRFHYQQAQPNDRITSIATNEIQHRYQQQPQQIQSPVARENRQSNNYTYLSPSTATSSSSSSSSLFSADNNFPDRCENENRITTEENNSSISNSNDSEENYHLQQRSYSPPTPCPSIWSNFDAKHVPDSHELLQLLEPNPVFPPAYDTLPPGGCPRFPVLQPLSSFEEAIYTNLHSPQLASPTTTITNSSTFSAAPSNSQETTETLPPSYSPSIYKIGVVSRKVEWVNPYEMSTNRSWKYLICELNSTQLNFYNIPPSYEEKILDFVSKDKKLSSFQNTTRRIPANDSILTNDFDHQFYDFVKNQGLLEDLSTGSKKKGLVRTYSLQYARIGLATDYQKRVNVLRLRIESEQILLHFENTQDLIDWNMSLTVGKDIAIDVNERELPKYRTVPRRRRRGNRRNRSTGGVNGGYANHSASNSPTAHFSRYNPTTEQFANTKNMFKSVSDANKIKGRFNKLRSKFSSSRLRSSSSPSPATPSGNLGSNEDSRTRFRSATNFSERQDCSNNVAEQNYSYQSQGGEYSLAAGRNHQSNHNFNYGSSYANSFEDDEDDVEDYDEEFNEVLRRSRHETSASTLTPQGAVEDDQEDIQSMSDLRLDEDEEDGSGEGEEQGEDEEDEGEDTENGFISMARSRGIFAIDAPERKTRSNIAGGDDYKWNPCPNEGYSKRRYYRNCLRCIKPLTMEDSWVYKPLVKPTPFSPLNVAYLKAVKYAGPNGEVLASASVSVPNSGVSSSSASITSSYRKNGGGGGAGLNTTLMLPDTALTKLPNHFLKEFCVGPHGLVPKEII
ncbi:hypothetical protein CORT_0B02930 [Candida orthopsilosis Co 90-125]|uniref:PH domain-containing protein n=1 Tax=Candida orthopsilosis (strain 90-125) TaxID=1136231 RepID=H8X0W8_CANO9|nr:hypothetical protein CORT_0B02930 [Candida orthopsilosis Co 90-125]CCG22007.1 hypothetical protein CORT_0B02930 [Candida orthopsilosis Co 90-125]